jgi:hypothetical protein
MDSMACFGMDQGAASLDSIGLVAQEVIGGCAKLLENCGSVRDNLSVLIPVQI